MLVLEAGDRVAADALVIEAQEMEADESLLTGEAVPVRKRTSRTGEPDRAEPGGDDTPYLFSGAVITPGRGIARGSAPGLRRRHLGRAALREVVVRDV